MLDEKGDKPLTVGEQGLAHEGFFVPSMCQVQGDAQE